MLLARGVKTVSDLTSLGEQGLPPYLGCARAWYLSNIRHKTHVKAVLHLFPVLAFVICTAGAQAADGKALFAEHCASCHGADGKGRTPAGKKLGAKDLTESKAADADIIRQILDGINDAKGKARMPAFREKLSTDDASALTAFVKTFRK